QLERLGDLIRARRCLAERYNELLSAEDGNDHVFRLPETRQLRIWYRYAVEMTVASARPVVDGMQVYGVAATEPVTDWRRNGMIPSPIADRAYHSLVSLPLYPTLTPNEQQRV